MGYQPLESLLSYQVIEPKPNKWQDAKKAESSKTTMGATQPATLDASNLLELLVKNLVSVPDDVFVERTTDEMGVLLTLHVSPADMGRVIGREGVTAQAIRTIIKVKGLDEKARINMKIFDPNPRPYTSKPPRERREYSARPAPTKTVDEFLTQESV